MPTLSLSKAALCRLVAMALVLALGTSLMPVQADDDGIAAVKTPRVSPHDTRDYRLLTLDNGLQVLLVSDGEADKAAASMNVSVGSAHDPEDLAGLAHFLEHMLFLGTEEFPEADAYQSYINRHGGTHNAFTAPQDTNYFFDIEPEALPGALERFSRFFVSPLFNADQLSSERSIVHSEYQARRRDEGRRELDVMNQLLNPDNPTTQFAVGSRETLADRPEGEPSLRERVIEFYERYYDTNLMQLAIVAPQPLDELETLVQERFTDIASGDRSRPQIEAPLVREGSLPMAVEIQSLRDSRRLRFLFPMQDPRDDYRTKPADYIAHLLGHEGDGSLLAVLRDAGLADGLSAGVSRSDGNQALFSIDISLTPRGAEQQAVIQATLMQAIEQIRDEGLDEWRYTEQTSLAEQQFRFQQHGAPMQSAMSLAMNLAYYPSEDVNYASYRMDGFDREQIERYLSALTPDNMTRIYSAPDIEGDQTSPWFDADYRVEQPEAWESAEALDGLALPSPNPYVAEDLTLIEEQDSLPVQLVDTNGFTLWHQTHSGFNTPTVEWRFSLQHPQVAQSARDAALTRLLAGWLDDSLNETFYPARLAGHRFESYAHSRGITLSFSGWRDRQDLLMRQALSQLIEGTIDDASVDRVRYRLVREWRNAPQGALHQQANRTLGEALVRPQWSTPALLKAISELDADDLREFRQQFLDALRIEAMAVGNLRSELAEREASLVANALRPRLGGDAITSLTPLQGKGLPDLHPQTTREESIVLRYLQGPNRSLESQARLAILGQLIDTPFYTRLRSEEQLGYVVHAGYSPLLDAPGLALLVQSPDTTREVIQERIDLFLDDFETYLAELDDDALAPYRQSVRDSLLRRDTSLGALANRLWIALSYGDTDFDRRERLAAQVMQTGTDELCDTWSALREREAINVTFDPGDTPSDITSLTEGLQPLPDGED
ncbi:MULTISPECIES: insulinase family protein [Halomonadaceae]|uniref:insulinase family protein n=1 Tax=Halomonadaceae TaxID=28256 RepID=UPI00200DE05F|nr:MULTISPECIES: insulinase family protein [Halomonas]